MAIEIRKIFHNSTNGIDKWINWLESNLIPFPITSNFLTNKEELLTVLSTESDISNPIEIFGIYNNNEYVGSVIFMFQHDDNSAEISHFIIDSKYRQTYISGKAMLETGIFIDSLFNERNIIYAQTSIPVDALFLEKVLLYNKWDKKAVLNKYQKIIFENNYYRRDVIYFEKIYNN